MRLDPEKVRRARESLGYSIEATGEKGDLSPNSVLRAEHGEEIRPSTARRLAKALNTEVADLYPKVEASTSSTSAKVVDEGRRTAGAGDEDAWAKRLERMEDIRDYTYWARTVQKWISRELDELKTKNDRERISELFIMANSSSVGIGQIVSADEDIESIESDTSEELSAERAMWEAVNELQIVADAVEAELHQVDDEEELPAEVTHLANFVRRRKAG